MTIKSSERGAREKFGKLLLFSVARREPEQIACAPRSEHRPQPPALATSSSRRAHRQRTQRLRSLDPEHDHQSLSHRDEMAPPKLRRDDRAVAD